MVTINRRLTHIINSSSTAVAVGFLFETLGSGESIETEVRRFECFGTESPSRPYALSNDPVPAQRVALADARSIGGAQTGQVYKVR